MLPGESRVEVEIVINRLAEVVVAGLNGRADIALFVLVTGLLTAVVLMLRFTTEFREPASRTQQAMGGRRQPDDRQSPHHDEPKQLHRAGNNPTQPRLSRT